MTNELNPKRRRGVVLTQIGRENLNIARDRWEWQHHDGNRLTNEELSEITKLSPNTITKIFLHNSTVDRTSLARCFSALGVVLSTADWEYQAITVMRPTNPDSSSLVLNIAELIDRREIERFVAAETSLFDEIRQLVKRQLDRTSERELLAMYWLAIRQADETRTIA